MELMGIDWSSEDDYTVLGGYKDGKLICIIEPSPHYEAAIAALQEFLCEVKPVSTEELALLFPKLEWDFIMLDDVLCPDADRTERKRRGKRKNPNPYQNTMKRGH